MRYTLIALVFVTFTAACPAPSGAPAFEAARGHRVQNEVEVTAAVPACTPSADCTLTLSVLARTDTHVNREYPHRFVPDANPVLKFQPAKPTTFVDDQHAELKIPFRAAGATAPPQGVLAVSVCNDAECFIEKVRVDLAPEASKPTT